MVCSRMGVIQSSWGQFCYVEVPQEPSSEDVSSAGLQELCKALGYHHSPLRGTGCLHRHSMVAAQVLLGALVCLWPV